jgi:hypothetical protein
MIFGKNTTVKDLEELLKILKEKLPKIKFAWFPVTISFIDSTKLEGKIIWLQHYIECRNIIYIWNLNHEEFESGIDVDEKGYKTRGFRYTLYNPLNQDNIFRYPILKDKTIVDRIGSAEWDLTYTYKVITKKDFDDLKTAIKMKEDELKQLKGN